jgi:DNA polymerase
MQHEADGHEIVFEVIEEGAAARLQVERPAEGMLDEAGAELLRVDLPEFLDADAEFLRRAALHQIEAGQKLLGQAAARALGEEGVFRPQFHARRMVVLGLAVAIDAHVAGGDAGDRAVFVVEHFGRGEARIDLHAKGFRMRRQIAGDIAERADEIAMIAHQRRHEGIRKADMAGRPEKIETVVGNLGLQRAFRILSPFGQKPVEAGGIDDRAREDMRADLGALLHDDHGEIRALFIGELFEADRGGKPGGSGTDDDDVEIHRSRRLSLTRSPPLDAVNPVSNDCYNWQAESLPA